MTAFRSLFESLFEIVDYDDHHKFAELAAPSARVDIEAEPTLNYRKGGLDHPALAVSPAVQSCVVSVIVRDESADGTAGVGHPLTGEGIPEKLVVVAFVAGESLYFSCFDEQRDGQFGYSGANMLGSEDRVVFR